MTNRLAPAAALDLLESDPERYTLALGAGGGFKVVDRTARYEAMGLPELIGRKAGSRISFEVDGVTRTVEFRGCAEWHQGRRVIGYALTVRNLASGAEEHIDLRTARVTNVRDADEAKLPECTTFAGTGQRCTNCRIRKALHA